MAVTLTVSRTGRRRCASTDYAGRDQRSQRRLLAYAALAVEKHAPVAPSIVQNEAVIRVMRVLV